MRLIVAAASSLGLAACGGGGGEELAAGNSQLSPAQIDAALGPADQSTVEDAAPDPGSTNEVENAGNAADNADSPGDEDEE